MDSHEKLGNLLSQYLSSQDDAKTVPQDVVDAFHSFGLTEYASREHVDETYHAKKEQLQKDMMSSGNSRFSREFNDQQKKEIDDAYTRIINWLDNKA